MISDIYYSVFKERLDFNSVVEDRTVSLFFDNFANKKARKSFTHKNRFHILYWMLSEYYCELHSSGLNSSYLIEFSEKEKKFIVKNNKLLFCMFLDLKRRLEDRYDLSTTNYPRWLKKEHYLSFRDSLNKLISKPVFINSIFKGRPKNVPIIKNQEQALALVKGSMALPALEKIMRTIYDLNPGSRNSKFKSSKAILNQADKLYNECKSCFLSDNYTLSNEDIESKWKALRITKKKCVKYILYWGALSSIQQYHRKSLEVSSKREAAFFGYGYNTLRKAMSSLKLIKCTDTTFCPGVRSRVWQTKVMLAVGQKAFKYHFSLNNVESKYDKIYTYIDKDQYASSRSIYAIQYLAEKARMNAEYVKFKAAGKKAASYSFMAYRLYKDDPDRKQEALEQASVVKTERFRHAQRIAKFHLKYSDPKTFDWYIDGREATA